MALRLSALVAPVAIALALAASPARAQMGIAVGTKAPAAPVQDTAGRPANLSRYFGRGTVVIEFWATWCPYCRQLEPAMRTVAQRHRDVRFVGVAVGVNQSLAAAKRYAENHRLPLEILYDATGAASDAYDVPATSYVVVVDRTGTIVYTGLGGEQDLEAAIAKAR